MRNRLHSRVRLLLLTATLRSPGPLQYVLKTFGHQLESSTLVNIHQSNLRPEIRVTTSILESPLTSSTFPQLRWIMRMKGITIIFVPDRTIGLRVTLYLRRIAPRSADAVRKWDALNDKDSYDKETLEQIHSLDLEREGLVIVATTILMTGVDFSGVKRVINLEPEDFDTEIQMEGRALRQRRGVDEIAEAYTYVSQKTMDDAAARVEEETAEQGRQDMAVKKTKRGDGDGKKRRMDIAWARRLMTACRTVSQVREYNQGITYGHPICTCIPHTIHPLPINPPCLCSGCRPGECERDKILVQMAAEVRMSCVQAIAITKLTLMINVGFSSSRRCIPT
jgi:superfamily II DNA/RNA helicase